MHLQRPLLVPLLGTLLSVTGLSALTAAPAGAEPPAGDEPGVTLRVFPLSHDLDALCEIKAGQTPTIDELKPTIDYRTPADFASTSEPITTPEDRFLAHVIAHLTVPDDGDYDFRLTSDDGSELLIDDQVVIDHDGLHGAEPKDGTATLTAGTHDLRVNYFESTGGEQLTLEWQQPGDTEWAVVPTSVLSTPADVVRVTSPGTKQCEGQFDSPGDGLQLDSVNPGYDLVDLRPDGFEPQVSGLEWDGDDLLVLTWGGNGDNSGDVATGELYRLTGVKEATSPDDVTRTLVAEGLKEPMGIKVVEGDVYVSQKHELSRLVDGDGDGTFEATDTVATWPFDGNFHEFAFGMLYRDGSFYLNLSVSIDYGGATTNPQGSDHRGTHIKVDKDTGAVEYVAGGLRTPNGIGWGPEGEVFATDNQGAWLPANKLIHVQPGKFYNHYTTGPSGPGEFDHLQPTKPALWMPHNEIANSPSTPVTIPTGPFAGQMWISDVTYGGIQRAFLEKVDGEYQGALFRMTQGLEAGVNRLLLEDDGTIYAGGLGAGGNWGQAGKLSHGLQKLEPNGTTPFDMVSMKVIEGGFEVEYTEPLSAETLEDLATKYTFRQWTYRPTAQYGGPKIDEQSLDVTSATPSEDGRTVRVMVDGLRPDRVVYLRTPRPFTSADGEELWSTEAWYTLNSYPGYVPQPAPFGVYELEAGVLTGGANVQTEHAGYSGSGFVGGLGATGAATEVEVVVEEAGLHDLRLGYANGPHPFEGAKTISMYVNGERKQISLPSTGAWTSYSTILQRMHLREGVNTVRFSVDPGDDGSVNLDYLQVGEPDQQRYEAEEAALAGGAAIQTDHPGFSGTGYVGGYLEPGASTTFTVPAEAAGEASLTLGYANGPDPFAGTKTISLYVNDTFVKDLALPDTGAWAAWRDLTETVELAEGENTISFRYDEGDDGNVNLDYLDVGSPDVPCGPVATKDDEFDADELDTCRWSTTLNRTPGGLEVRDGALRINAQDGDLSGANVTARNVILQPAPADGTWSAETHVSIDGEDDYLQAGLVAHTTHENYGKVVVMRRPEGDWVIELGRRINGEMVYDNSAPLPDGAQQDLTLQMVSTGSALQARWSLDDGTTWETLGAGYPLTGLTEPKVGLAAYNGTGSEVGSFDYFRMGEPVAQPDTCEPITPEPGYRMLFDGTQASLDEWKMAGPGFFTREADCTLMTHGGLGLLWHPDALEGAYSLTLDWKLTADHNSGVFVGFPDPGTDPWVGVNQGHEIQIDASDDPDSTTGAIYNFQAADLEARDAALNPQGEWNSYEIQVDGDRIKVFLNDTLVNDYTDTDPARMNLPHHVGLQNHGGGEAVLFRNVQINDGTDEVPVVEPDTRIDSAPSGVVRPRAARVTFRAVGDGAEGATFECSLDGGAYQACTSPTRYTGLEDGRHVVRVRAVNEAGPDPTPALARWIVDRTGPRIRNVGPRGVVRDRTPRIRATISDRFSRVRARDVRLVVDGKRRHVRWRQGTVSFTPKNRMRPGRHHVRLVVRDALGNTSTRVWRFRIRP